MFFVGVLVGAAIMLAALMIVGSVEWETTYTVDGKQYFADLERIAKKEDEFIRSLKKQ